MAERQETVSHVHSGASESISHIEQGLIKPLNLEGISLATFLHQLNEIIDCKHKTKVCLT